MAIDQILEKMSTQELSIRQTIKDDFDLMTLYRT